MSLDEIASELAHLLKAQGYKKQKLNWFRSDDGITIAFTIQKSYYSSQTWYYCFGVSINAFHEKEIRSAHSCEIQERFDSAIGGKVLGPRDILNILKMWEHRFGTMEKLREFSSSRKTSAGKLSICNQISNFCNKHMSINGQSRDDSKP